MKEYRADAVVTLPAGRVRLDVEQARTRAHNLGPREQDGTRAILRPIQFKRGERFGWDGEVPKGLREAFGDLSPAAAVSAAAGAAVTAGGATLERVKQGAAKAMDKAKSLL